jgi:two-component system, NarL family, sensor histidine kinase UhpB
VLDDLGLVAAIERLIGDFNNRHPMQVDVVFRGMDKRLPVSVEAVVYRIVQEALTNIARHARAKNASILLEHRADSLRLIVEDDGVGFDPSLLKYGETNLGLQGIRERANLLNGKLMIESQSGSGTSLFVEIPINEDR